MSKFKESELSENLKEYQDKCNIEIEIERSLNGKINLENATVEYNSKNGFINIKNQKSNFNINTTLVYRYEKIDDVIYIDLDCVLLKIRKI